MKILNIINESLILEKISGTFPLVTVDIQPAYESWIYFDLDNLVEVLNKRNGATVMYVNSDTIDAFTEDSMDDIKNWWIENGVDEHKLNNFKFIDKGYGYLRPAMDSEIDDAIIIKAIRDMYQQKVHDSRDLYKGDENKIMEIYGDDMGEILLDGIQINFINISWLKQLSPFYLCGGGKNECLKEVMLLCDAMNVKYKLLNEFVY
jgi:hypothetical protein